MDAVVVSLVLLDEVVDSTELDPRFQRYGLHGVVRLVVPDALIVQGPEPQPQDLLDLEREQLDLLPPDSLQVLLFADGMAMVTFDRNYLFNYFIITKAKYLQILQIKNVRESIAVVDELAEILGKLQPLSALLLQLNLLIGVAGLPFLALALALAWAQAVYLHLIPV